jgi:hypothetical protein
LYTSISIGQSLYPAKEIGSNLFGYKSTKDDKWKIMPAFEKAEEFYKGRAIVMVNNLYGVIDNKGAYLIKPIYHNLEGEGYLTFKSKDTLGIISPANKVVLSGAYQHIFFDATKGTAIVKENNLYGYWDTLGNFIQPISEYELAFQNRKSYYKSKKAQGFISLTGKVIIETEQENLFDIYPYGYVVQAGQKECLFDSTGHQIGACEYDKVIQLTSKFILYEKDHKYGIVSYKGETLYFGEYEYLSPVSDKGFIIVKKNGKYGVINESLNEVLPPTYDYIEEFGGKFDRLTGKYIHNKTYSLLIQDNKYGVIDDSSKVVLEPQFLLASIDKNLLKYTDGDSVHLMDIRNLKKLPLFISFNYKNNKSVCCFEVKGSNKCGIINKGGKILAEPLYSSISPLPNGLAIVANENGKGLLDTSGKILIPLVYKDIQTLNDLYKTYYNYKGEDAWDGFMYVKDQTNKVGVLNETGKLIVDTAYFSLSPYDENGTCWFAAKKKNSWILILENGKKISTKLDRSTTFNQGVAIGVKKGKYGLLNTKGKMIASFKYDEILEGTNGLFYHKKDSLWGLMKSNGQEIVPAQFTVITPFFSEGAFVKKKNTWGIMDELGVFYPGFDKLSSNGSAISVTEYNAFNSLSFSFNTIEGYDEVSFDLLKQNSDNLYASQVNNYILNSFNEIFKRSHVATDEAIVYPVIDLKLESLVDYKGMGLEIVSLTKNTITLNRFTEESLDGATSVKEFLEVLYFNNQELEIVKLSDLFVSKEYIKVINEAVKNTLMELGIPSPEDAVIYEEQFQITEEGLLLKIDAKLIPEMENLESSFIAVSYEKLQNIVQAKGPLQEFFK